MSREGPGLRSVLTVTADVLVLCAAITGLWLMLGRVLQNRASARQRDPTPGVQIGDVGVDWRKANRTLLIIIEPQCRFCRMSASFDQELLARSDPKHVHIAVIFPRDAGLGRSFLREVGLRIDVAQGPAPLPWQHVQTPTLLLCDNRGTIEQAWIGRLDAKAEEGVLAAITAQCPGSACR